MNTNYRRIISLVRDLNFHTKLYDEGRPLITDEEWDKRYFELKQLEEDTGLILSNSPTQTISYEVVNSLQKVEHSHKMLSLAKTKSLVEAQTFVGSKAFLAMGKMDGLTCALTFRDGKLVAAETRGNGIVGENILHNARVLPSIPASIPYDGEIEIDGEIICTYDDFEVFSNQYKNPRNFAAGSIRLLDSEECAKRKLTFVAWDVLTPLHSDDGVEYTLSQKLEMISSFGFTITPYVTGPAFYADDTMVELDMFVEQIMQHAHAAGFPIDGIVFKFDNCAYGRSLGATSHHFKNAIAYKFYDEKFTSNLLDIQWTMGRTGVLTPVAIFEPIDMDGSIVERASLHNVSIMREIFNGIPFVGQEVSVFKANMIIPQISEASDTHHNDEFYATKEMLNMPTVCPVCGGAVKEQVNEDSVFLVCANSTCNGKLINRLDHFCGKKGLDIKGVSKATLEKLIDWGWVEDFSDIFKLSSHRDEWIKKPGFGVKSVDKILASIETGAHCELHQFIAALGIPLIGTSASKDLAKCFEHWDAYFNAIQEGFEFDSLPNFGCEMHRSIVNFNYTEALRLMDFVHFVSPAESSAPSAAENTDLSGLTFVVTGKLTRFKNRDAIKARIEALGGKVTGSVSKNTNYLINNDVNSTSSKNATAKSLGIPILSEDSFIEMFNLQ